jgi:hypothetical protein
MAGLPCMVHQNQRFFKAGVEYAVQEIVTLPLKHRSRYRALRPPAVLRSAKGADDVSTRFRRRLGNSNEVGKMFELLLVLGFLALGGILLIGLIKLLLGLVLLPIKLGFWVLKGVLALVLLVPLVIIGVNVFAAGIPIVLFILALPLLLLFAGVLLLLKLIF